MIDLEIAAMTLANLKLGDFIKYDHPITGKMNSKLLEINPTYVVVQGGLNKLAVPVIWIDAYKEHEMRMPIDAIPSTPGQVKRGRRSNAQIAADKERDTANASVPLQPRQGVPQPPMTYGPALTMPNQPQPLQTVQPPQTVGISNGSTAPLTIEQAEGNANWIDDGVNTMIDKLRIEIFNLLDAVKADCIEQNETNIRAALPSKRAHTCWDCMHIDKDMQGGFCTQFNLVPPMFVIVDSETKCVEFVNVVEHEAF